MTDLLPGTLHAGGPPDTQGRVVDVLRVLHLAHDAPDERHRLAADGEVGVEDVEVGRALVEQHQAHVVARPLERGVEACRVADAEVGVVALEDDAHLEPTVAPDVGVHGRPPPDLGDTCPGAAQEGLVDAIAGVDARHAGHAHEPLGQRVLHGSPGTARAAIGPEGVAGQRHHRAHVAALGVAHEHDILRGRRRSGAPSSGRSGWRRRHP